MKEENRQRLLALFKILLHESDEEHPLSTAEIIDILKYDYGLKECDRKTIYSDIKVISEHIDVESTPKGYKAASFFDAYEIKILCDLLDNFKSGNEKSIARLKDKLFAFISKYDQEFIKALSLKHKMYGKNIYILEMIINAIKHQEYLKIKKDEKESLIIPYFLNLERYHYYLYYAYANKENKIYKLRIDRIESCDYTNEKHYFDMHYKECLKLISNSLNSYISGELEIVKIELLDTNKSYILTDLKENFEDVFIKEKIVSFKTTINKELFGFLARYGNAVKIIAPLTLVNEYQEYLKAICKLYQPR